MQHHTIGTSPCITVVFGMWAALAPATGALAQCTTPWLAGDGLPGANGPVITSAVWDRDGPGSAQPVVLVSGHFSFVGSTPADGLAAYEPATGNWSALGWIDGGHVASMLPLPNGELVVGGTFSAVGGLAADRIARWNGAAWSALGAGCDADVNALAALPNGDLVAAGAFTTAGGIAANGIARWNGTTWSPLGSGVDTNLVTALATRPNGDLIVGGGFVHAGGVSARGLARWDGSTWSAMGIDGYVHSLTTLSNGDLVAAGAFHIGGAATGRHVARWDGTSWYDLNSAADGDVHCVTALPSGKVLACGDFTLLGGVNASRIACWTGNGWSALGAGLNATAEVATALPNGHLLVGGAFRIAGNKEVGFLARWDGANWSSIGAGLAGGVSALAVAPNGDLVAAGDFGVRRWNGLGWVDLGGGFNGTVFSLVPLPNGDLVAGGQFTTAGGSSANNVARWDGVLWSAMGTAVIAGGGVSTPNFGIPAVFALAALPNGDVIAGGGFRTAGLVNANFVARWDGTTWSALGSGMSDRVLHLNTLPNGVVLAGGGFLTAAGLPSPHLARLTTTCLAAALPLGPGCPSSGGGNLVTASLPWAGGPWTARGSGLPAQSWVLAIEGFSPTSVPLSSLLPEGLPGCRLWVQPDDVRLVPTQGGAAQVQLFLPNTQAIAGIVFHHQMVVLEFAANQALVRATTSNALTLTVGAF